jgi:hypothetical protein
MRPPAAIGRRGARDRAPPAHRPDGERRRATRGDGGPDPSDLARVRSGIEHKTCTFQRGSNRPSNPSLADTSYAVLTDARPSKGGRRVTAQGRIRGVGIIAGDRYDGPRSGGRAGDPGARSREAGHGDRTPAIQGLSPGASSPVRRVRTEPSIAVVAEPALAERIVAALAADGLRRARPRCPT